MDLPTRVVTGAVWSFLALVLVAAMCRRLKAGLTEGSLLFRYGPLWRGYAIFAAFGVPAGITMLTLFVIRREDGDLPYLVGTYALFAAVSVPLFWEVWGFAVVASPGGLDCHSPWRWRQFFRWEEIARVSYSGRGSWFIFLTRDGRSFRVPVPVRGVERLLEMCERRLPLARFAKARAGYKYIGRPFPLDQPAPLFRPVIDPDALRPWGSPTPHPTRGRDEGEPTAPG
jgi:hypothetical protein